MGISKAEFKGLNAKTQAEIERQMCNQGTSLDEVFGGATATKASKQPQGRYRQMTDAQRLEAIEAGLEQIRKATEQPPAPEPLLTRIWRSIRRGGRA